MLVVELNGTGTSLGNSEATGLGLDVLDFVPSLLGDVLGHQGVLGLDLWEWVRHCLILKQSNNENKLIFIKIQK